MSTKKVALRTVILCIPMLGLSGCDTLSKAQIGATMGTVVGGVIGHKACGEKKDLCAALGALAGGYLGNKLGKYLDEQDRQKMATATQQAVNSGKTQVWSNPDNKTSGSAKVISTQKKSEPVKIPVLKEKIAQVPPLDIIGETYQAKNKSNLRGGPGTDYEIVGSLSANEAVTAVGKVKGSNWYLISKAGVGSGFIYAPLMKYAPDASLSTTDRIAKSEISEQKVSASSVCREIEQSVTLADGSSHSETLNACQTANGWKVKA